MKQRFFRFVQSFTRKTSGQRFVPEIDGLRFFAIFTVLLFHLNTAFSDSIGSEGAKGQGAENPFELGWWIIRLDLGVKVFFAISGFILALPFIKQYWFDGKKIQIKTYLLRRLTRLEPPYVIAIILFYGVHVFILHVPFEEYFGNFLASLGYIHTIVFDRSSIILPISWSLEVEVQFYLLVPLLSLMFFKSKKHIVGILIVVLFFILSIYGKNYIMAHHVKYIGSSILAYFSHFAIGILFSILFLTNPNWIKRKSVFWDSIGLIAIFSLFYFYKPQIRISNNILFNLSILILFISAFKGVITNYFFRLPVIYVIGGMCYSIYLIHFPLLFLLVKASKQLAFFKDYYSNYFLQIIILLPLIISVSAVYFKLFEQPFMDKNWPRKLRKSRTCIRNKLSNSEKDND